MEYETVEKYIKNYGVYSKIFNKWKLSLNKGYEIEYQEFDNEGTIYVCDGMFTRAFTGINLLEFKEKLHHHSNIYDVIDDCLGVKRYNIDIEKFMWGR